MSRVSGLAVYVIQWRGEISNFNNHKKYISILHFQFNTSYF